MIVPVPTRRRAFAGISFLVLLVVAASAHPLPALGADEPESDSTRTNGAYLDLGFSGRLQQLYVRDADGWAKFSREWTVPMVAAGTPTVMFGNSGFGCNIVWSAGYFTMDRQQVGYEMNRKLPEEVYQDVGTEVNGYMSYVTPTLFYRYGKRLKAKVGMGLGIGYLHVTGDVLLNNPGLEPTSDSTEAPRRSIAIDDIGTSLALFAEYRWRRWTVAVTLAVPVLDNEQAELLDGFFTLSYSWYLPRLSGASGPSSERMPTHPRVTRG